MASIHFRVHGRVQGVYFRAFTQRTARALGLVGWVRNRTDGTVEGLAGGDEAALERLEAALHQGPPASVVDRVQVVWGEDAVDAADFQVASTSSSSSFPEAAD